MEVPPARINQSVVSIRLVRWVLPQAACDRCARLAPRVWEVGRGAVDIDLDRPVLLRVTVGVHYCAACRHYFRAQPPFLRRDATDTDRVVAKAVASVLRDGMPSPAWGNASRATSGCSPASAPSGCGAAPTPTR
jgi:hypothetical protein